MNSTVIEPYSVNKIAIQEAIPNEPCEEPSKTKDNSKKNPLQCGICGLIICNKWNLTLHMRVHNNDRRYKCDQCSASFIIAHDLKKHTLAHAGIKPTFKCRFCDKTYTSSHCKYLHEDSHNIKLHYKCRHCPEVFEKFLLRKIHERESHIKDGIFFNCSQCSKKFTSKDFLEIHEKNFHKKVVGGFRCNNCDLLFETSISLNIHKRIHGFKFISNGKDDLLGNEKKEIVVLKNDLTEVGNIRLHECIICLERYASRADMITHMSNAHSEETKTIFKFACNQCDKIFKTNQELMQHLVSHNSEKKYSCFLCDYKAKRNTDLKYHMRKHTKEDKKKAELLNKKTPAEMYECIICLERYTSRADMVTHMSNTHPEETKTIFRFTCNKCDKIFKKKQELTQHMITHNGEKKYCCSFCDYKSKRNTDLKVHMRKHTEDISYVCEICSQRFFQIKLYQQHKNVHIKKNLKKVFKCEHCGVSFYNRKHLQCHANKHESGGFKCINCSKLFANPYTLKRHVKSGKCEEVGNLTEPVKITIEKCPLSVQSIEKRYECFACGFSTWSELIMSQHESSHNITDVCDKISIRIDTGAASEANKKIETNHWLKVTKFSPDNSNHGSVISSPSVSNSTVNLTYTPLEESLNFSDDDHIFDAHLCPSSVIEKLKSNIVVINGKKYLELDEIKLRNTESVTPCLKNLLKVL